MPEATATATPAKPALIPAKLPPSTHVLLPAQNCRVIDAPDGTMEIAFRVRPDLATRVRRRAGTRKIEEYVWEQLLRQFESVCY